MIPAPTYESICESLLRDFVKKVRITDYKPPGDMVLKTMRHVQSYDDIVEYETIYKTDKVKMIGILFVQPSHKIAKEDILPNITYYHERSGKNVNFYLAGYGAYLGQEVEVVCRIDSTAWQYSPKSFNNLREEIEKRSKWKYSGECDLIILNAKCSEKDNAVLLDFSCCVAININDVIRVGAIPSTMNLFEVIFRYAESQKGDDPTWGLSDKMGVESTKDGLKNILLNLIPRGIGKEIEKVRKMAVINISKDQ